MDTIKDKVERFKLLAEMFINENKYVFIKDIFDTIYFCELVLVGEDKITIDCFGPKQRAGKRLVLYWLNILELKEFEDDR